MEAMNEEREMSSSNSVMCLLTDPEGAPLGSLLYIPQHAGPAQLQEIVNKLLNNEEKLPYAFYISDQELVVQLGSYLQKNKVSVEKVLRIVYQPLPSNFQNPSSESMLCYYCGSDGIGAHHPKTIWKVLECCPLCIGGSCARGRRLHARVRHRVAEA